MSPGFRIVEHTEQHVGHFATVLPVAQSTHGADLVENCTERGDGAQAREEVDEQVARHAGAVVAVVAPAEEAQGSKGLLGGVERYRFCSLRSSGEASSGIG